MSNLEFGVFDECSYNWFDSVPQAVDAYEQSFREVQLEEEVGFKYHFVIEHQGHVVGQVQTPAVFLAALARHTSTIRIGAMVFLLPFHDPLRLAMDCAMVDQLSHGRLEFGAGVGSTPDSFNSWNVAFPISERRAAGAEALDVIEKAWQEERFTYHGKYYNYDEVIPLPHPYQQPHPPMWFAGRSEASLELCVARKYGVGMFLLPDQRIADIFSLWRRMWKDSGHKGPRPPSFLTRSVYVAETDEQACEEAALYLPQAYTWGEEKFQTVKLGTRETYTKAETDIPDRKKGRETFMNMRTGIDFWLEHNLAYVGSPETVIRRIEETHKMMGYDVFGGRFRFGPMPDHLLEKSLRLFGEKVIPAFADKPVASTPAD
jgi:alkanesulfonate monooxygenase SsuD/methylene tetrahydromethanopterin reductase-like flavin-dependent oxidoreductase (luciferase family)